MISRTFKRAASILVVLGLISHVDQAQAELRLPEPEAPPVETILENGESPLYYRRPSDVVISCGRVSLGSTWRSDRGSGESGWGFSLDVMVGTEIGFGRASRPALLIEGGYAYVREGEHMFSLGTGLVVRRFGPTLLDREALGRPAGDLLVSLVPHLLVGTSNGELAWGVRTGVLFSFAFYGLLISHQYLRAEDRDVHEVQVAFTANWRYEQP